MAGFVVFLFGAASYSVFFAVFLYAIGFIGGFATPTMLDGVGGQSFGEALVVDLALLAVFAVQHSVMARPAFKRWWTRFIPVAAERSMYVLLSSLALALMFAFWQPIGGRLWDLAPGVARNSVLGLYGFGWALLLYSTFLIDHFDLFGLRQVWRRMAGKTYVPPRFHTPSLYRIVRHPLYVGWLVIFWAAPTMTVGHLVFALATTAYILIAIGFEERDLADAHPEYAQYRRQVPMLVPDLPRRSPRRATVGSVRT